MADGIANIAYEETVRGLTAQAGVLDNLRTRAGTLIAVASLVTSFLGGQALAKPSFRAGALERQPLEGWAIVAIVAFVLVAVAAIVVLWPRRWNFTMSAAVLLTDEWRALSSDEAKEHLAAYHEENYESNRGQLDMLFWAFRVGCVLLVVETIAWILDLSA
jgi:hypothetical protein